MGRNIMFVIVIERLMIWDFGLLNHHSPITESPIF
jgi:hypothetical protein